MAMLELTPEMTLGAVTTILPVHLMDIDRESIVPLMSWVAELTMERELDYYDEEFLDYMLPTGVADLVTAIVKEHRGLINTNILATIDFSAVQFKVVKTLAVERNTYLFVEQL